MFLNKFLNIQSLLNLSLPLFLGQISNLIMPFYVFLIEVWLAKISFLNLISIKSYRVKTFGGSAPLSLRPGKVKKSGNLNKRPGHLLDHLQSKSYGLKGGSDGDNNYTLFPLQTILPTTTPLQASVTIVPHHPPPLPPPKKKEILIVH